MEEEKIIECVRQYEFLYNLQHPKYMDPAKKEMAWKGISEQVKLPAAACKQKWQNLRDAYRRALNKRKLKSGQAGFKIKKWKYEDEMSFVAPFFNERKPVESAGLSSDEEEYQNEDLVTEVPKSNPNNDMYRNDPLNFIAFKNTTDIGIQTQYDSESSELQHSSSKKGRIIKRIRPVQTASSVMMSRLLDSQIIPLQPEHDEIDRFFLNISETVKKFSRYQQAVVKHKVFSLVSELELKLLSSSNFGTSTPQYPRTPSPVITENCQTSNTLMTKYET